MQSQTITQEVNRGKEITSSIRTDIVRRREILSRYPRRQRKANASTRQHRFSTVNGTLNSINDFDVRKHFDSWNPQAKHPFINTEQDMIDAINFLYPIVKEMFVDFEHHYYYRDDTTPGEFLSDIFELLNTLNVPYVFCKEGDEFEIYSQAEYGDDIIGGHGIEVWWFDNLNPELSKLAYQAMATIIHEMELPLYHGIDDIIWFMEDELMDCESEEELEYLNADISLYQSGRAAEVEKLLRQPVKVKYIKKKLMNYQVANEDEAKLINWLITGLDLSYDSIMNYTLSRPMNDDWDEFYGINMHECCSVYYSTSDPIFERVDSHIEMRYNEGGVLNFGIEINLFESHDIPTLPDWIYHVVNWLDDAWGISKMFTTNGS
jgi:hypothetical protein